MHSVVSFSNAIEKETLFVGVDLGVAIVVFYIYSAAFFF